jgi:hypothetical protein
LTRQDLVLQAAAEELAGLETVVPSQLRAQRPIEPAAPARTEAAQAAAAAAELRADTAEARLAAVEASTSWRVTAPLRQLSLALRSFGLSSPN